MAYLDTKPEYKQELIENLQQKYQKVRNKIKAKPIPDF